jgi:hypothetical protein
MTRNKTIVSFHVTPNIGLIEIVPIHAGIPHNVYVAAPHVSTNCNTCSDIFVTNVFYDKIMLTVTLPAPTHLI